MTNARVALDQKEFQAREQLLTEKYEAARTDYLMLKNQIEERKKKAEALRLCIEQLKKADVSPFEFDEEYWSATVSYATVFSNDDVRFTFKDGTVLKI